MNGKWMLAVAWAVLAFALTASAKAASPTLYVGDTREYASAFKAEGENLYVIELAGPTECYYTEPHVDIGPGFFNVFAAPTLLRSDSEGLHAYDYGAGTTRVRAELAGDAVTGDFLYSESELSYHCDTGFVPKPFQASRYEPAASGGAPVSGERPVYYGSEAATEVFLRAGEKEAFGIRGTFVPRCRVGKGKTIRARHALFDAPVFAKLSADRSFEKEDVEEGTTRSGVPYREKVSLAGSVDQGAAVGTYLRVRVIKPRRKPARRCVTGPLPFRAVRYLPAAG
jgi:hypothetical protein